MSIITSAMTTINPYMWMIKIALVLVLVGGVWYNFHYIHNEQAKVIALTAQQITLVTQNNNLASDVLQQNRAANDLRKKNDELKGQVASSQSSIADLTAANGILLQKLKAKPVPADTDCSGQINWLRDAAIITSGATSW